MCWLSPPGGCLWIAAGIRVPAPCPPTRSGRRVTFARRPNMVGAERQPPLPLLPAGPALRASDAGRGQSRCPLSPRRTASGAGAPVRPREAFARAQGWGAAPRLPGSRTPSSGPRGLDRLPPSAPRPLEAGKGRRLAASASSQDCAQAPGEMPRSVCGGKILGRRK